MHLLEYVGLDLNTAQMHDQLPLLLSTPVNFRTTPFFAAARHIGPFDLATSTYSSWVLTGYVSCSWMPPCCRMSRAIAHSPPFAYALTGVERLSRPPQTRTRAHRWAARTPGARPMHPLRSPHARATTLLRRRRGERLECTDAVAGSAAGCHAVWRRDASFLSPARPRGCGRWSTRTTRAPDILLAGVGATSCPTSPDNGAPDPILMHAPRVLFHPPSLLHM